MAEILLTPYLWIIYLWIINGNVFLYADFPLMFSTPLPSSYVLPRCSCPSLTAVAVHVFMALIFSLNYGMIMYNKIQHY